MGITGKWAERQEIQSGAAKWGTGYNPVHAVRTGGGRDTTPEGNTGWVDPAIVSDMDTDYQDPTSTMDSYADTVPDSIYGYGTDTGTADRPRWDQTSVEQSFDIEGFPSWGPYQAGLPGGTAIRAEDHGSELSYVSRQPVVDSASAGWFNKRSSEVNQPEPSSSEQYTVTTSMKQRDQVRAGSQMATGRASTQDAPISSRPGPMKDRSMVGDSQRWYAMEPKVQFQRIRPWWPRQAGTGMVENMKPNTMYASEPLTRQPPSIPYQGPTVGSSQSGWTDEDGGWY